MNAIRTLVNFVSGYKTYLFALAAIIYGLGIGEHWWDHSAAFDWMLGGGTVMSLRAAIAKACAIISAAALGEPLSNDRSLMTNERRRSWPIGLIIAFAIALPFSLGAQTVDVGKGGGTVTIAGVTADGMATPEPTPVALDADALFGLARNASAAGNLTVIAYPSYAPKLNGGAWGAGIAALYQLNQFTFAGLRADVLDGNYFAASASVGLKADLKLFGHTVTPFAIGGVVSPLSGAGDKNKSVGAIVGVGVFVPLWKSGDGRLRAGAFGSVETWPGIYDTSVQIGHVGGAIGWSF